MIHTLRWSRASVCSLAGCDVKYIVYLPDYGAYGVLVGSDPGERFSLDREMKIKKVYDQIASFAPDLEGLVLTSTNNPKAVRNAIKKIRMGGPRRAWYEKA